MQSQVIVEDKRDSATDLGEFQWFESGQILRGGQGSEIYLKVGSERAIQLTGNDAGKCINASPHITCKPLPHLRLRMILEDKPCT